MRSRAYWLFELVAWPAAVWGAIELALRLATKTYDGLPMAAATASLAALTIVAARWRSAALAQGAGATS